MVGAELFVRGLAVPSLLKGAAETAAVLEDETALAAHSTAVCVFEAEEFGAEWNSASATDPTSQPVLPQGAAVPSAGILPLASLLGGEARVEESGPPAVQSAGEGDGPSKDISLPASQESVPQWHCEADKGFQIPLPALGNIGATAIPAAKVQGHQDAADCTVSGPDLAGGTLLMKAATSLWPAGEDVADHNEPDVIAAALRFFPMAAGAGHHPVAQVIAPEVLHAQSTTGTAIDGDGVDCGTLASVPVRTAPDLPVQMAEGEVPVPDGPTKAQTSEPVARPRGEADGLHVRAGDHRVLTALPSGAAQGMPQETGKRGTAKQSEDSGKDASDPESGWPKSDRRDGRPEPWAASMPSRTDPRVAEDSRHAVGDGMAAAVQPPLNAGHMAFGLPDAPVAAGAVLAGSEAGSFIPKQAHLPLAVLPVMISTAQEARDGPVTVLLSPDELGTVRFEVQERGDSIHVSLTIERPETLDLLRRHVDQLVGEFRQAGFSGASFSFSGSGGGGEDRGSQHPYNPVMKAEAEDSFPTLRRATAAGLDLRI